jgi:phosphoenolpyruvate carboxylase
MARKDITFPLKDAALRDDVHALGNLVGEMLRDQGGDAFFAEVEGDRQAAIGRRNGDPEAAVSLIVRTRSREPRQAEDLIRAFSTWFQMVNMAEKVHRVRRRRQYLNDSSTPQPGGLEECFIKLRGRGLTLQQVIALLGTLSIEPVFTAHPTESTRRTLLRQQQRIANLLIGGLDPTLTPAERGATIERVRTELTTSWQTADNSREKLTVADEREHVLFFLVEVVYEIIPAFYEGIENALCKVFGDEAAKALVPEVLHFGSWVGGDMDGHPDVHAKTIRESCARHNALIVNRYFLEAQKIAEKLSQSEKRVAVSEEVKSRIEHYRSVVPAASGTAPTSHDRMPYRVLLTQMAARLRATYDHGSGQYERAEQLIDDLELIARSLVQNRGQAAGLLHVRRMLRRVRTFGFHLATLDVRQNAEVHRQIIGRSLDAPDWLQRTPVERMDRLRDALARDESPPGLLEAAGKRALWVFEAMEYCSHRYGASAIGSYVVSMANGADDIMSVLLLARWAGFIDNHSGQVALDVAPLFESVETLESAGEIMAQLLGDPIYRAHVAARGDRQVVMIGYADSNKESGITASRWLLRKAQVAMQAACTAAGVGLVVFHGRSGSVSRGGSRAEAIVRSVPSGFVAGRLRVTEQGETINDRYGLQPIALRTFEQGLNTLALGAAGFAGSETIEPSWRDAMELLAHSSRTHYRAVVHDDPGFLAFFRLTTPVDVIERMQIGSRPLSRAVGTGVDAMRAVPWMFAWSQSRHMLPGWFGAGHGLRALTTKMGEGIVADMYRSWPYFQGLIDDIEMRLARADMGIAEHYEDLAGRAGAACSAAIRDEFTLARDHVLHLKGCARLLDSEPTMQRSIWLRNPYVDPIHLTQIELLRRWREAGSPLDGMLLPALLASVNGIAQGLQGTG